MSYLEWISTILSLIYVVLAIRNNRLCFPFAVVASGIWAYLSWEVYNLRFDGMLQAFYLVMAVIGFVKWGKEKDDNAAIQQLGTIKTIIFLATGTLLSVSFVWLGSLIFETSHAYIDAFTTVFSVLATILMIYRVIDNWIYLLICDLLYIYIYYQQGAHIFALLMIVYSIMAVVGFISWRKLMQTSNNSQDHLAQS